MFCLNGRRSEMNERGDDRVFAIGDTIIYTGHSVCKITGIRNMTVGYETSPYFVIKPVFEEKSTLYIPVGNKKTEARMRPVLSVDEIYALIRDMPDVHTIWIENENERKELYNRILSGADRSALVTLIITLYLHEQELKEIGKGKKLHASDERFLKDAEEALYDEFAHVLDIDRDDVLPFIFEQIEKGAQNLPDAALHIVKSES